jgi:uncharacterized protein (TIGR02001 family)
MHRSANRFIVLAFTCAAAAGLAVAPATAQDMGNSGNVSLSSGVDIVNQYYFRGIVQETGGFIAQPFLDGSISFGAASITAGTWSSLHSRGDEGFAGAPGSFYETDFYMGIGGAAGPVGVDVTYTAYMSPRGSWGTTKEIALGFSVDNVAAPYVTMAFEVSGGADGGPNKGNYLEFGIEPAAPLDDAPVSLSFPVAVGMSMGNYFEYEMADGMIGDSTFGFFSAGASIGIPLNVPEQYGAWELALGVNALVLGEGAKAIDGGDSGTKLIALFGLGLGY